MRGRRAGAALAGGLLLVLVGADPGAAHNRLRSSDPGDGSTLARTPAAVVLTLDEPPVALGTRVLVTGPNGPVSQGAPQLVDKTVRQPLVGGAAAGRYTVEWRATSADGHPVSGRFSFVSEAAGSGTPGPVAPAQETVQAPSPGWGWVVLALALLAAAGVVALLRRRSRVTVQD